MCILTMRSMTNALRAQSVLAARGLDISIVTLDPALTEKGCAYGIRFSCNEADSIRGQLSAKNVPFGVLIGRTGERT